MDLKEAGLLGPEADRHWYYASKSAALLLCLSDRRPHRILDVGAGSGLFSRMLLDRTPAASAVCVDPGYAEDRVETQSGKPLAFRRQSDAGDADLVLFMDVLEHVDDDIGLLRAYAATARAGTRFVVSTPAFPWLWSSHDIFLEHRRRYTLKGLLRLIADAGLSPTAGFYFFGAVFPLVAMQRLLQRLVGAPGHPRSDLRRHHPLTNRILTAVCLAECFVARRNRLFGLTAFAVAEKR